jgi:beta-lactamase regulating signal transducer with metallopeptidase domain
MTMFSRRRTVALLTSAVVHLAAGIVLVWPAGRLLEVGLPSATPTVTSGAAMTVFPVATGASAPPYAEAVSRSGGAVSALAAIVTHVWESTLFALAVAAMTLVFRREYASLRHWLWFSASLKFFVPFSLLFAAGRALAWPAWSPPISNAVARIDAAFRPVWPASAWGAAAPSTGSVWTAIAAGAWAIGFVAVTSFRLSAWRRARAVLRRSQPVATAGLWSAGADVRSASDLLEPCVIGFLHPVILLPDGIDRELTVGQLRAVVSHEACHVQRRDNLTAWMHMLVEAAYWWNPAVWWIGGRLVYERERACDQSVLRYGHEARAYMEGIVAVCRRYVDAAIPAVGVGGSSISKRVEAILRHDVGRAANGWKKVLLATVASGVLLIPIGSGALIAASVFPAAQSVYTLTLVNGDGRLGPRLRPAAGDCSRSAPAEPGPIGVLPASGPLCGAFGFASATDFRSRTGGMAFRGLTMAGLATKLGPILGRSVVDRTGLPGYFDADFDFIAEIPLPPPPPGTPRPPAARPASALTVFPNQLGLKFQAGQAPKEN